jgi:hypothetical protein
MAHGMRQGMVLVRASSFPNTCGKEEANAVAPWILAKWTLPMLELRFVSPWQTPKPSENNKGGNLVLGPNIAYLSSKPKTDLAVFKLTSLAKRVMFL